MGDLLCQNGKCTFIFQEVGASPFHFIPSERVLSCIFECIVWKGHVLFKLQDVHRLRRIVILHFLLFLELNSNIVASVRSFPTPPGHPALPSASTSWLWHACCTYRKSSAFGTATRGLRVDVMGGFSSRKCPPSWSTFSEVEPRSHPTTVISCYVGSCVYRSAPIRGPCCLSTIWQPRRGASDLYLADNADVFPGMRTCRPKYNCACFSWALFPDCTKISLQSMNPLLERSSRRMHSS